MTPQLRLSVYSLGKLNPTLLDALRT
jgi:hypothetical protein